LNVWAGGDFEFNFDEESLLLEGPNGSGKSSLTGAIIWALSAERPRDQITGGPLDRHPVFDHQKRAIGSWPPIAVYPPSANELKSTPKVSVELTFANAKGELAQLTRRLDDEVMHYTVDPRLDIPAILLEAGILMPSRLAALRLGEKDGRLGSAVQKLTGLDDLIAIGALTEGLCHKAREYQSYKKKELGDARGAFDRALQLARDELIKVKVQIPTFVPNDTRDTKGAFARLGKTLIDRATELTQVIASDLASNINLGDLNVQNEVIASIASASSDLDQGLDALPTWKTIVAVGSALDEAAMARLRSATAKAQVDGDNAAELLAFSAKDTKFQLKAVGAQWHEQHSSGPIEQCPLCARDWDLDRTLADELEQLRSAGAAAARTFDDNVNAIIANVDAAIPEGLRAISFNGVNVEPKTALEQELREKFVEADRYANELVAFGQTVEAAIVNAPQGALPSAHSKADASVLRAIEQRRTLASRLLDIAAWYGEKGPCWIAWWKALDLGQSSGNPSDTIAKAGEEEGLRAHLARLSDALAQAEPYRKAAGAMRDACKQGQIADEIEIVLEERDAVATNLTPLKQLGGLCESVARDAIEGLSVRIENILNKTFITEQLRYGGSEMSRKEGFKVHGGFTDDLQIDVTLVANTSWLRAVLWAFIFALREEAVGQFGNDPFPLFVLDDPQATFDGEHRHRWAQQIAALQAGPPAAQVIIATHDEMFRDLIKVSGVTGRDAMIPAAGPELGRAGIFEGAFLDRAWLKVQATKSNEEGRNYIKLVRQYVEGMLRLMLRGEKADVQSVVAGSVMGDSRAKIEYLQHKGFAPWSGAEFAQLIAALKKSLSAIRHLEIAHHAGASALGMQEATDVESHWRKRLGPAMSQAFKIRRDHLYIHGAHSALHAATPTVPLPEGYKSGVSSIGLTILGRAAALSNGRSADGSLEVDHFPEAAHKKIRLAQHGAYRLAARTLEPAARIGDIVIIKEVGEPSPRSLVVAIAGDRILARRFEIAEGHSDIAVLTARSINPREISAPVIAHRPSLKLHKIVGVLFAPTSDPVTMNADTEVSECDGQAVLNKVATDALGLVEVVGQSAEPLALNAQYLIIKKEIDADRAISSLVGKPVVASDSDDNTYFKRLQVVDGQVVLESLDIGGDFPPVVLHASGASQKTLNRIWPVAGVLFELP